MRLLKGLIIERKAGLPRVEGRTASMERRTAGSEVEERGVTSADWIF